MRLRAHLLGVGAALLAGCFDADAERSISAGEVERAHVVLEPVADSGVTGRVTFERVENGVRVTGRVESLGRGAHGFHVHEYGDVSEQADGASAGDHFATEGEPHGRRSDDQRHSGDLGNIEADSDGVATFDFIDDVIELSGEHAIVGRALVVHAKPDDFSQPSGNAGDRVAFGVIGIAAPGRE